MSLRYLALASYALSAASILGRPAAMQDAPPRRVARAEEASSSLTYVFEGLVLAPDGTPSQGAVLVSSAGGKAVTNLDGTYRLEVEVPIGAVHVQISAVAGDHLLASRSVDLPAVPGSIGIDPLLLAIGSECSPRWLPTFGGEPGVAGSVGALAVFDHGSGPMLYAGGSFLSAGGVPARYIAEWDGTRWSALSNGIGLNGPVNAMAVFDAGSGPALYVGGSFTMRGQQTVNRIARWNGVFWSALGSGLNGQVQALAVFDDGSGPALYVGGTFSSAGGVSASRIAKWDGAGWSALGGGLNSTVHALAVFDDGSGPALYAGGEFTSAGGTPANRIARWSGSSWSALGSGMTDVGSSAWVRALLTHDDGSGPALYAGGSFTSAGGAAANHIARWDGSSWSALAGGMNGSVNALAVFDDGSGAVLVGGSNGAPQYIARWNGSSWSPMRGGMNASVLALTTFDDGTGPVLYAGGSFTSAGNLGASRVAEWSGASWSALGNGLNGAVHALSVFDDGGGPALYAGGKFTSAGGVSASLIAKWDDTGWSALGGGLSESPYTTPPVVHALTAFDDGNGPALIAGGEFVWAGNVLAHGIARWDGVAWSALGSGLHADVLALIVFDDGGGPALYAGTITDGVQKWNGSFWSDVGSEFILPVQALAVFDDGSGPALFAGGWGSISRWNGTSWSVVGGGISGAPYPDITQVMALAVFDDGTGPALYVGGEFEFAGSVRTNGIARWDGVSWSALGSGVDVDDFRFVASLAVFDDGSGPALYAGGSFSVAGGVAADPAKWNGVSWSALGSGTGTVVKVLAAFRSASGSSLFAGGTFASAPDSHDSYLARWAAPLPCLLQSRVRRR